MPAQPVQDAAHVESRVDVRLADLFVDLREDLAAPAPAGFGGSGTSPARTMLRGWTTAPASSGPADQIPVRGRWVPVPTAKSRRTSASMASTTRPRASASGVPSSDGRSQGVLEGIVEFLVLQRLIGSGLVALAREATRRFSIQLVGEPLGLAGGFGGEHRFPSAKLRFAAGLRTICHLRAVARSAERPAACAALCPAARRALLVSQWCQQRWRR